MAPTARFCGFPQGSNQEEFHPGGCKGQSTLPTKPFGHLKTQWETHYMNTHNLCGSSFENGEPMRSFRIFSSSHGSFQAL